MIDLTPLDVRKKSGDFTKALRGYDPAEVESFLSLVAERLEELVKENLTLRERTDRLSEQVASQEGRERAVQEALVTAQELRDDVRKQAAREANHLRREAAADADRILKDAERLAEERRGALEELERKRLRFLRQFRSLLERELDVVAVEEGRAPLEDVEVELDLGRDSGASGAPSTGLGDLPQTEDAEAWEEARFGGDAEGLEEEVEEAFVRAGEPGRRGEAEMGLVVAEPASDAAEESEEVPQHATGDQVRDDGAGEVHDEVRGREGGDPSARAGEGGSQGEDHPPEDERDGGTRVQDDLWLSSVRRTGENTGAGEGPEPPPGGLPDHDEERS